MGRIIRYLLIVGCLLALLAGIWLAVVLTRDYSTPDRGQSPTAVTIQWTEEGYRFMRQGEPFLIRGGAGGNQLAALAAGGGNTIRVYHPDSLPRLLDEAGRLGLAVIADIPLPVYVPSTDTFYRGAHLEAMTARVRDIVIRHRNHPALLCWMLGNEIHYGSGPTHFKRAYNGLVDLIHELDPDHPVSTAIVANQLRGIYLGLERFAPDFISINIFGSIGRFVRYKDYFQPFWNGPYLLSEWSTNGYWEESTTAWGAPIEPPGPTQARQLRERYVNLIEPLDPERCLGNLVFHWGFKREQTDTWYSFFDRAGRQSQRVLAMNELWSGEQPARLPPQLEYLLLEGQGAASDILRSSGQETTATATYLGNPDTGLIYHWWLEHEAWFPLKGRQPPDTLTLQRGSASWQHLAFTAPDTPGPYRLCLHVTRGDGLYAAANIPFYVLDPRTLE